MTRLAAPSRDLALQGHYAGAATRLASYAVDTVTVGALYAVGAGVFEYLVANVLGASFDIADAPLVATGTFVVWSFLYLAVPLAASGRTFGSAVLGLRVVRGDGRDLDPRHAVLRVVVFPLSFLLFGAGFVPILLRRDRHALHDLIADTAVVYSWDARAARVRFLAKAPGDVEGPP